MGRSRKSRRRQQRQYAKRTRPITRLSPMMRIALIVGGLVAIMAGVALLARGDAQTAARLGRVAGILILLGLVGLGVGLVGKL